MNMLSLSKTIAHALRHDPLHYELEVDEHGWAPIRQLLDALHDDPRFAAADIQTLRAIVDSDSKGRYEMDDTRIRALYGHSFPLKILKEPAMPPDMLYHGTARRFLPSIMEEGLTPRQRQYVHLSADTDTARSVGRRRDDRPAMLVIDAARAHADGIIFYRGNDKIWLADAIPPQYITHM